MRNKLDKKYFLIIILFIFATSIINAATPGLDTLVNYDTAWTYLLDGGMQKNGTTPMKDVLCDVKELPGGSCVFVGVSGDTAHTMQALLMKFDATGKINFKQVFTTNNPDNTFYNSILFHSIAIARNGDLIAGGRRGEGPYVIRLDTLGNIKWTSWYYDSINDAPRLLGVPTVAAINSIKETSRGTIIGAVGEYFSDDGYYFGTTKNAAGYLEFDSMGKKLNGGPLYADGGYNIGGFCIEEASPSAFIVAGNQAINYIDTSSLTLWQRSYGLQVEGAGSQINNVIKCKKLRNSTFIVAGQAYEGNCWIKFQKLYYDAWWSPITSQGGTPQTWDTAGGQGSHDALYDFTQLNNGNIVFVGAKGAVAKSLWTFVADSTGKRVLWEKTVQLSYRNIRGNPRGFSVCATKDGGFSIAGELVNNDTLGGVNALAMHYKPVDLSRTIERQSVELKPYNATVTLKGSRFIVHLENKHSLPQITFFNAAGRIVTVKFCNASTTSGNELTWDFSTVARGVYFYSIKTEKTGFTGSVVTGM